MHNKNKSGTQKLFTEGLETCVVKWPPRGATGDCFGKLPRTLTPVAGQVLPMLRALRSKIEQEGKVNNCEIWIAGSE